MNINFVHSLLLENIHPHKNARILTLEGGDGLLAKMVAKQIPQGEVKNFCKDVREVWASQKVLSSIPNASTSFDVFPTEKDFDIVLLAIPKGRRYSRKLLLSAWSALRPGGKIVLVGPTRKGAKAVIKDAEALFGDPVLTGYRNHNRIGIFVRGDSLPEPLPEKYLQHGIAPGTTHYINLSTSMGKLILETHPGIFSWDAIDEGTSLLLDKLEILGGIKVWDVGCGYGVIGLFLALQGASKVLMTDINLLAIRSTQNNTDRNHLTELITTLPADGLSQSVFNCHPPPYDLIVSNPAFHQERAIDASMADNLIKNAPGILSPKGKLVLVANRFLNYNKSMSQYFKYVNTVAETNKFHVLAAHN